MSCALCLATGRARRPSRWLEPPPASPSEAMPPHPALFAAHSTLQRFDRLLHTGCEPLRCFDRRRFMPIVRPYARAGDRARPSRKTAEPEAARPHPRRIARMRCLQVAAAVSSGHTVVGTGIYACGDPHRPGTRPTWVAEAGISAFFVRFKRPIRRLACAFVRNGLATGKSAR